jgi:hypothetical protein
VAPASSSIVGKRFQPRFGIEVHGASPAAYYNIYIATDSSQSHYQRRSKRMEYFQGLNHHIELKQAWDLAKDDHQKRPITKAVEPHFADRFSF